MLRLGGVAPLAELVRSSMDGRGSALEVALVGKGNAEIFAAEVERFCSQHLTAAVDGLFYGPVSVRSRVCDSKTAGTLWSRPTAGSPRQPSHRGPDCPTPTLRARPAGPGSPRGANTVRDRHRHNRGVSPGSRLERAGPREPKGDRDRLFDLVTNARHPTAAIDLEPPVILRPPNAALWP